MNYKIDFINWSYLKSKNNKWKQLNNIISTTTEFWYNPHTLKKTPNKPNLNVSLSYIMISLFIEQINSLDYVCVKFKHF